MNLFDKYPEETYSTEGFVDSIKTFFNKKKEPNEKTVVVEEGFSELNQWFKDSFSNGKLASTLRVRENPIEIDGVAANLLYRGDKQVDNVIVELNKDIDTYRSIFNKYKTPIAKASATIKAIKKDLEVLLTKYQKEEPTEEDQVKEVDDVLRKYVTQVSFSIIDSFQEPKPELLGKYGGLADGREFRSTVTKPKAIKASFDIDGENDLRKLVNCLDVVAKLWVEIWEFNDKTSVSGLDPSDPPLRRIWGDLSKESISVIDKLNEHDFYNEYVGLFDGLVDRLWDIQVKLLRIIKASVEKK